jgi:hypothetical protein
MAFNWVISQLDSIPSLDGMDKVISTIHWRAQKQHENFTADTYGALSVDAPHESSFTPYDEVTQSMVEGWLDTELDMASIEANLDAQIENQINPPIIVLPNPWDSNNIS